MSYSAVILVVLLCSTVSFLAGLLVYRNNRIRLEGQADELKKRIRELEAALKGKQ